MIGDGDGVFLALSLILPAQGVYNLNEFRDRRERIPPLELEPDTRVEVGNSSAETRYMVLPERPPGTEGLSEEELAALVARDSMCGRGAARAGAEGVSARSGPAAVMMGRLALPRRNGELVFEQP